MKKLIPLVIASLVAISVTPRINASSERKAQEIAASGKPVAVKGGLKFDLATDYDAAFDAVVKALKLADSDVVVADREAGLIATEIEITGGWKQTGTRTVVSLIKDNPSHTIVKVAVTEQKRYKALQTEPWSDPKLDAEKTAVAGAALKKAMEVK